MKIGIFTFHGAINYGAVLQAYGLQEYLKSLGHEVHIIDYRPDYLMSQHRMFRWHRKNDCSFMMNVIWLIRECLVLPIRIIRKLKFRRFINKYLNLYSWNADLNVFDVFVFGSDQIWNPTITRGFDNIYFGDFPAARDKILVTYGASVGSIQHLRQHDSIYLKSKLLSFHNVTVREKSLADFLKNECGIMAKVVPDPVLLVGRRIYDNLAIAAKEELPYLLLVTLGRYDYAVKCACEIAKQKQLKIIEVVSSHESIFNTNVKQTLAPDEFLGYLKNASFVVTSSFHGTVFSILFNKNFKVVIGENKNDERIISLLKDKGLLDNLIQE